MSGLTALSGARVLFRRRQGVRVRSTIVGTCLIAIALVIGATAMLFMLYRADNRSMYESTSYRAYEIASMIRDGGVESIPPEELMVGTGVDIIQVIDGDGRIVASSPGAPGVPVTGERPATWTSASIEGPMVPGTDDDYCGTIAGTKFGDARFTVVAAISAGPYRQSLFNTALLLAIELPILVILSGFAIYYFVGRALRPVGKITEQVNMITSSDLSLRVPVPSTDDEVTRLASTMNAMLTRLEQGHEAQLRFVGDASHEMRSPLTTVVGILDLADDTDSAIDLPTVRTILLPEARRMQNMVDDLLLLARADERGVPLRVEDVDLDDIVAAEAHRLRSLGLARVESTITPIRIAGDRDKLARAVRNLAENAVRYAQSTIRLDMRLDTEGMATILVTDDGPGIPEDQRALVFRRFTRLDVDRRNREGSGLGLSIVAEIVRAHGGSVATADPPAGFAHGITFVISLPTTVTTPGAPADGARSIPVAVPPAP
ncbi:sensor histidine kinase [Gordonia insulae]|uniref:histidine kinase n=1 Tax=Gordonia insulae TaxID=2420509 RepID=A0A3G8JJW4_9ACTN|nr:ATP-binding protein [Gordonia insulae]AZG45293.1 Sensor protein CzcS [Gordonia insulae]